MKSSVDPLVELEMVKNAIKENSERALGQVKAKILPIQKNEAENIKEAVRNHRGTVEEFRKKFRDNLPYHVTETAHEVPKHYCKNYKDRPEAL
jgi:predicted transcriptional regulator